MFGSRKYTPRYASFSAPKPAARPRLALGNLIVYLAIALFCACFPGGIAWLIYKPAGVPVFIASAAIGFCAMATTCAGNQNAGRD